MRGHQEPIIRQISITLTQGKSEHVQLDRVHT